MEEIEKDILDYLGYLTEVQNNLRPRPVLKPAELRLFEQCKSLRLPVWEGGLQDQPHIWLLIYGMVEKHLKTHQAIWDNQQSNR